MTAGKNILVTGGLGYVGSRLTPHLLALGHRVRVIDLDLYGDGSAAHVTQQLTPEQRERFQWIRGDIRDPRAVTEAVKGIDAMIHLAAISNDPTGAIDETLTRQVNFDAVGVLLAVAKKEGVRRFINASSSSVFGIKHESDVNEALEPEPLTHYSKYKMLSEWLVVAASSPDFCAVNIRPATICGFSTRQRFDLTVNKLTADAVTKGVITVHGGQQRRPNVGMTDVINLYGLLLDVDAAIINGRTFNFGFENLKVIEIAEVIRDELKDRKIAIEVTPTQDNRDYHISSTKLSKALNYRPVSSIRNEVLLLREKLDAGAFKNIEDSQYHNMKCMKLERSPIAYEWLAR